MARHSNRHEHLQGTIKYVGELPTGADNIPTRTWKVAALCNDEYGGRHTIVDPTDGRDVHGFGKFPWAHDICTKCQSLFYAKWIKENPSKVGFRLGDRIDLSRENADNIPFGISRYTWKSVYPVYDKSYLIDDRDSPQAIVAFICIESGWGKNWQVHGWKAANVRISDVDRDDFDPTPVFDSGVAQKFSYDLDRSGDVDPVLWGEGGAPRTYTSGGVERRMTSDAKGYGSKEYALLNIIPNMVRDGALKTYNDRLDEATGYRAAERERQAERAREAAERQVIRDQQMAAKQSELEHIKEALMDLVSDGRDGISNYEREGLFLAAKQLGIDLTAVKPYAGQVVDSHDEEHVPVAAAVDDDDWSFS